MTILKGRTQKFRRLALHIALLSAAATLLLLTACSEQTEQNSSAGEQPRTPIAAYEVVPRDLSRQLNLSATVQPRVVVNLNSRAQGMVSSIAVEESDYVTQGQRLAEFDVAEQQAELNRAQARAQEARLELERIRQLSDTQTIARAELERAEASYAAATAERDLWQTRLSFGVITAPTDGVITARYIQEGEAVEPREPLFVLAKMDELVILSGVSERDVRHLAVGQEVPVQLDALPDEIITGSIRRIFPAADAESRLIHVEVLLPSDSYERGVRPGFLARLPLIVDSRPDSLAVPAAAIGEDGSDRYVYQVIDDRLTRVIIQTGITRGQWTEVVDGIDAGAVVLATNPIDMRDGTRVRIVNWRG